jgi:hypothetical protein
VVVAARLLQGLSYVVVTGDKGYLSQALKAQAARQGVDLIARHKRNMRPHTRRERYFLQGHRMVESVFSSLDRLGLSERSLVHRQSLSQGIVPYRKTQGLVFHLYAVLLGYGLFKLMEHNPAWRLLLAQFGGMWLVAFPNWGVYTFSFHIGLTQLNVDKTIGWLLTSARRNRVLLTLWASCFWNRYTL